MKKEEMVTRLIHMGETFYRLKDVAEMRNVSVAKLRKIIKEQNIESVTIEGFGRTKWIKEQHVNEIEINNEIVYMRTEFKDYQRELDLKGTANALACAFLNKEFDTSKVVKETLDSMDNFALANESECNNQEDKRKIETFNQIFEELGVANRFHSFEFLVGNKINQMTVMINADGRIVQDKYFATSWLIDEENIGYIKDDINLDGGIFEENGELFRLDFGEPFECDSVYLINELIRNMSRNKIDMFSNDWIDVGLDNGEYLGIKFDTFLDMLNEDIRVVA